MRVLVTGATGFVGTALCRRTHQEGWLVRGAVRNISDKERLPQGVEAAPIGSIGPDTQWESALAGVDIVVHLAARTHVTREIAPDPLRAFRFVNVQGTERLARVAAASGVKRFVYLSSVKVNGEGREEPYTELDPPAPEDPYGISKWETEQLLLRIAAETGMEIVIIRPPLVYGPGVKANFLTLMNIVARGVPLPFATVNNHRSLIYLDNLVDVIVACSTRPEAAGKTYLVSDATAVSTPELIRQIALAFDRPARLFTLSPQLLRFAAKLLNKTSTVDRLLGSLTVNTSKIRKELGWQPPYTMKDGLRKTAAWYMNTSKVENSR